MYPVPRHLTEIFKVNTEESDENAISGKICCTCGCEQFRIKTYAEIDKEGRAHLYEYNSNFAFVTKGICRECQKEWLLFDFSKHGWEGFLWPGVDVPDSTLEQYHCFTCGSDFFEITIYIEVYAREEFIEEVVELEPDKYTAEDHVDAFHWITIDIKCVECSEQSKPYWMSLELS